MVHPYLLILIFLSVAFVGYVIGRIGHILGGHTRSPHHWLYGGGAIVAAVPLSLVLVIAPYIAAFGIGVFVSDARDFFDLKFYGVDEVEEKRFWGID